eukprot:TRINITY_DN1035_c0_g5_i1.p1 TRINITY_DN1035_c0_g5~~TRINITY_DN1035_c0_g5_i1.p1  ORF type:complete len:395 (+),score=67.58 TRINITY_DN1035_c0_g5_i1:94-1185(+)
MANSKTDFLSSAKQLNKTFGFGFENCLDGDFTSLIPHFKTLLPSFPGLACSGSDNKDSFSGEFREGFGKIIDSSKWKIHNVGKSVLKNLYRYSKYHGFVSDTAVDFSIGSCLFPGVVPLIYELKTDGKFCEEDLASVLCNGVEQIVRQIPHMKEGFPKVLLGFGIPTAFFTFQMMMIEEGGKLNLKVEVVDSWDNVGDVFDQERYTPGEACFGTIGEVELFLEDSGFEAHGNNPHHVLKSKGVLKKATCLGNINGVMDIGSEFILGRMLDNHFKLGLDVKLILDRSHSTLIVSRNMIGSTLSDEQVKAARTCLRSLHTAIGVSQRDPRLQNFVCVGKRVFPIDFEYMLLGAKKFKHKVRHGIF